MNAEHVSIDIYDQRETELAEAVGAYWSDRKWWFTPIRLEKWRAICRAGFEVEDGRRGFIWPYAARMGKLTLSQALVVAEAYELGKAHGRLL